MTAVSIFQFCTHETETTTTMRGRQWWSLAALLLASFTQSHPYVSASAFGKHLAFVGGFSGDTERQLRRQFVSAAQSVTLDVPTLTEETASTEKLDSDDRPHAQRATRPRAARRLNHSFRYLFRHDTETAANLTSLEFLVKFGGCTEKQVLKMNETFPPLLDLDVRRHLWPKLWFLQETIGVKELDSIPPQYFGARLERTIAPRHAFLIYQGLPHGMELLQQSQSLSNRTMLEDFLVSSRRAKQFCALCNSWKRQDQPRITAKQIEAFDVLFQRGLMPAARNELCQSSDSWPLQHTDITSAEIISLLLQHGANPLELDARGASLLHWAAGCGNLEAVKVLLPYFRDGVFTESERDGATPFHWAAAGAKAKEFGCGGHVDVCQYFLEQASREDAKRLINKVTKDGNSVLMWAAWSGTLNVVKLLVRNRADATLTNRNGCSVVHWAASGGNLPVCQYLAETAGLDFTEPNFGGNTPLTHAVAFGRTDVVEWLRNDVCADEDDVLAAELAAKFVSWTDGDRNRKEVLSLFDDWFGPEGGKEDASNDIGETNDIEMGSC